MFRESDSSRALEIQTSENANARFLGFFLQITDGSVVPEGAVRMFVNFTRRESAIKGAASNHS